LIAEVRGGATVRVDEDGDGDTGDALTGAATGSA
jgi:hypothetical protein